MKRILAIVGLLLFSCHGKKTTYEEFWEEYRKSELPAWKDKDTTTVLKWVKLLRDTSLSDHQFYDVIIALEDKTNFGYGIYDPEDKEYWKIPQKIRTINRQNTAEVYRLYTQSKSFMKEIDFEKGNQLQDKYWSDTSKLNEAEIVKLRMALDSLAPEHAK